MSRWYETAAPQNDIVISSRVRIARNLKAVPFPQRMNDAQKQNFLEKIKNVLDGKTLSTGEKLKYIELSNAEPEELYAMVERHVISPEFAEKRGPKGLVISEDETVSIMLLEEDHIRIQVLLGGLMLAKALKTANEIDDILSVSLSLAFDEKLGFLTACPTNLGTGLRASVMLHLPVLEHSGMLNSLADSISKIGLTVRGMYGEGSRAQASLYQLSNQVTLGISEKSAVENLSAITQQIISRERSARKELDIKALEDTVCRSLGTLKYARKISSEEAMNLLSNVKLGISMGILDIDSNLPVKLLIEAQPASLQKAYGRMTPGDRDICRAGMIRDKL